MITPLDLGLPAKFTSFREFKGGLSQFEIAKRLALSPKRFRGNCAPPGAGKSLVNLSASRILDSSRTLYLTVNKSLQFQLLSDCEGLGSQIRMFNLVGHSAYPCMRGGMRGSRSSAQGAMDFGLDRCTAGPQCAYWQDVKRSLSYPFVTTNIANWVSIAKVGDADRFGKFDFIILDEAHNLEFLLCSLLSLKFYERTIFELIERRVPEGAEGENLEEWIRWAKECVPICKRLLEESESEDEEFNSGISSLTLRLRQLLQDLTTLSEITNEWVIEPFTYPSRGVTITPVFASEYAEKYLFRGIPEVLLSSATLTSQDFEYLGVDSSLFDLIEVNTGFDPARRPFYYWPTTKVDFKMVEGQIRQVINRMDRIIDSRLKRGWKGLIHSVSYDHAELIARYSRHDIITHKSREAREVIDRWIADPSPSIIASPVMAEGVDLTGDLARFQFIWKVPTPFSGDPIIAARKRRDKKYPLYLAAKSIQQMAGRVNRGEKDFGETFILDKHWGNWMSSAVPYPQSFSSTWKVISDVPEAIDF